MNNFCICISGIILCTFLCVSLIFTVLPLDLPPFPSIVNKNPVLAGKHGVKDVFGVFWYENLAWSRWFMVRLRTANAALLFHE